STRIERVLASGTGAKIVTSHDDVCLIELQLAAHQNFEQIAKEVDALLQRVQIRPLATGIDRDSQLLQLCYTSEVAN
ncbi:hypothetical protein ACWWJS_27045, partial [Enterobacter cloacae]